MLFGPDKEATSPQFLSKDAEVSVRDDHPTSSVQADIELSTSPFVAREGGGLLTPNLLDDANCGTECRMMADDPLLLFAVEAEVTVLQRPKDFSRLSNETGHEQLVLSTQADPEVAKTESVVWDDLRVQLRETELAIRQSVAEGAAVTGALDPLRELATQLAGEYSRIQEVAREAEERIVTAVEAVQDLEKRLGPLVALQDISRHTDERFEALNALADEVTSRRHTLNDEKEMIDHAVVEAGRVADLIRAMEMRIAKLKDGDHLLEQTEARLGRLEEMSAETTAQLERREQLRDELGRELRRLETEVQIVTESARRQVAELVTQKKELEAFDTRPFTPRVLRHDHSTPIGSVDLSVKPPMLGVGWEELWSSPHRQLTHVMTRLRTRKTIRAIKRCGAGVGLALLALVSFIAMRPFGKAAPLDGKPLLAGIPTLLTISVPVLSGTNFMPDEPRMPRSTTTPPEYFGTLAVQSTPARAAVFIDRQQVGETPLQLPQVRAGSHAIWIEREGYKRWTAAVNIPASKITRVIAKLDAEVAR